MKSSGTLSVGAAAERFGLAPHVLRHWESVGLLTPERVGGDRRRYHPDDLYRIAVILRAKQAGFSLDDIREIITATKAKRTGIMRKHRDDLTQRIAALRASLEMLEGALNCEHEDFTTCPHFQASLEAGSQAGKPGTGSTGMSRFGVGVSGMHDH